MRSLGCQKEKPSSLQSLASLREPQTDLIIIADFELKIFCNVEHY